MRTILLAGCRNQRRRVPGMLRHQLLCAVRLHKCVKVCATAQRTSAVAMARCSSNHCSKAAQREPQHSRMPVGHVTALNKFDSTG